MHLTLTSGDPTRSDFLDEYRNVAFKTDRPRLKVGGYDVKIYRGGHRDPIALLEYPYFGSSRIKFQGMNLEIKQFMQTGGLGWHVTQTEGDRTFTAPDGWQYVWKIDVQSLNLFRMDSYHTPIATFCTKHTHLTSASVPAYLDIYPPGHGMIDIIFVTFVLVGKVWEDMKTENLFDAATV